MPNLIFCLVGPSGSGKSTIISEVIKRLPDKVGVIRSTSTRSPRPDDDPMFYQFVTEEEFLKIKDADGFVNWERFAGIRYGTNRQELDSLLSQKHGIWAMLESAHARLASQGYQLRIIRVKPIHQKIPVRPERALEDKERRRQYLLHFDLLVANSFRDGPEHAINKIVQFILHEDAKARTLANSLAAR